MTTALVDPGTAACAVAVHRAEDGDFSLLHRARAPDGRKLLLWSGICPSVYLAWRWCRDKLGLPFESRTRFSACGIDFIFVVVRCREGDGLVRSGARSVSYEPESCSPLESLLWWQLLVAEPDPRNLQPYSIMPNITWALTWDILCSPALFPQLRRSVVRVREGACFQALDRWRFLKLVLLPDAKARSLWRDERWMAMYLGARGLSAIVLRHGVVGGVVGFLEMERLHPLSNQTCWSPRLEAHVRELARRLAGAHVLLLDFKLSNLAYNVHGELRALDFGEGWARVVPEAAALGQITQADGGPSPAPPRVLQDTMLLVCRLVASCWGPHSLLQEWAQEELSAARLDHVCRLLTVDNHRGENLVSHYVARAWPHAIRRHPQLLDCEEPLTLQDCLRLVLQLSPQP